MLHLGIGETLSRTVIGLTIYITVLLGTISSSLTYVTMVGETREVTSVMEQIFVPKPPTPVIFGYDEPEEEAVEYPLLL